MSNLSDIAAIKIAIHICTNKFFKREFKYYMLGKFSISWPSGYIEEKVCDFIETRIKDFTNLECPRELEAKIISYFKVISIYTLRWIKFYTTQLKLPFDYLLNILTAKYFTGKGLINIDKIMERMLSDINILGWCICSTIVSYRTLRFTTSNVLHLLNLALMEGNMLLAKYCCNFVELNEKKLFSDCLILTLQVIGRSVGHCNLTSTIPYENYAEILNNLIPKLSVEERINIYQKAMDDECFRMLLCLFSWPYQHLLLQESKLALKTMRAWTFHTFSLTFFSKFNEKYENIFDYRGIYKEIWSNNLELFKSMVSDIYMRYGFLRELFKLKIFTVREKELVDVIFKEEKLKEDDMLFALNEGIEICLKAILDSKMALVKYFLQNCNIKGKYLKTLKQSLLKSLLQYSEMAFLIYEGRFKDIEEVFNLASEEDELEDTVFRKFYRV